MSNSASLAMLLDGPLQAWGFASRFTRRTTALFPTKSGVVGLLAAALGIDKHQPGEPEKIARLASVRCTVVTLPRQVRDRPLPILRLEDFHTIGGGYDPDLDWQSMPRSADNKALPNPVVSSRHYLMDARFGVLLEGEPSLLEEIAAGLRNPVWGVWFGRKCCLPACPLLAGHGADRQAAWQALMGKAGYPADSPMEQFDRVEDLPAGETGDEVLNDQPVAFGAPVGSRHAPRSVRHHRRRTGARPG